MSKFRAELEDRARRHHVLTDGRKGNGLKPKLPTIRALSDLGKYKEQIVAHGTETSPRGDLLGLGDTGGAEGAAQFVRDERGGDSVRPATRPEHGFSVSEWASGHARESTGPASRYSAGSAVGGEDGEVVRRKRGRVVGGDHQSSGGDTFDVVAAPWYAYQWIAAHNIGFEFTFRDVPGVPSDRANINRLCAGLSLLRQYGTLEAVDVLKTAYVYRYIAENTKPLRINRPKGHDYHGGAVGRHAPRLVRIGDVLPDGHVVASRTPKWKPGVSTRVQDKKNGIDYTHYNSGRIARLPETQPMPEDRVAHNSQQARIIEGMDFSMAEGRVIAHMMDLATSLPQAISALNKSLHLARLDILRGFTDDELLHELMRRRK